MFKGHRIAAMVRRVGLFGLVVAMGMGAVWAGSARASALGELQNVSNDPAQSIKPKVAQDPAGNIHIVWDSTEGSRIVRYAKGVWNGTGYTFGASAIVADAGNFGFSTPSVVVAPNGMLLTAWSQDDGVHVKTWNATDGGPSGNDVLLGSGLQSSVAADGASRFHIVWNGDYKVQYCQFEGRSCTSRETFASDASNRPHVAADSAGNIHVVWDGSGILYRTRPNGGSFGGIQSLDAAGNYSAMAADGKGNVHIAWSRDYNIQYCRRSISTGCERKTFDVGEDLEPTVAASPDGTVSVAFRVANFRKNFAVVYERGVWGAPQLLGPGFTAPEGAASSYSGRLSVVWSSDYDVLHRFVGAGGSAQAPNPTVVPTAVPTAIPTPTAVPQAPEPVPGQPDGGAFAAPPFTQIWERSDRGIVESMLQPVRSWIWGPKPITAGTNEAYKESPGGARLVQYFDKSRMEIIDPAQPVVTNGLLVEEMIAGHIQVGNNAYRAAKPAMQAIAGDPIKDNANAPTYASLRGIAYPGNKTLAANRIGQTVTEVLSNDGSISENSGLARYHAMIGAYNTKLGHNVPQVFQSFFDQRGLVYEGGYHDGQVIDPAFVVGLPIAEPYWTRVKVAGIDRDVMLQPFERRVLTFTPDNQAGFQVEMGNVGQHYLRWRYGVK
ncbi:MAG: hypothetical protein NVSMB42_13120 [Herpetosiphon sp.]